MQRVAVWAESSLETAIAAVAALSAGVALVPVNPKLGRRRARARAVRQRPRRDRRRPGRPRDLRAAADRRPRRPRRRPPDRRRRRRGPGAGRLHVAAPPAAPRAPCSRAARSPPTSTGWRTPGSGPATTSSPTGCRCSTSTASCSALLGPLRRGGELRHLGRFEPAAAAAALQDGATMLFGVPTMYHRIAREAEGDDSDRRRAAQRARILVSGSAPLPAPVFTRIEELTGQQIVERYGLTETLMNTAVRADSQRRPGYVGVPRAGRRGAAGRPTTAPTSRSPTTRRSARSRSAARTCSAAT